MTSKDDAKSGEGYRPSTVLDEQDPYQVGEATVKSPIQTQSSDKFDKEKEDWIKNRNSQEQRKSFDAPVSGVMRKKSILEEEFEKEKARWLEQKNKEQK